MKNIIDKITRFIKRFHVATFGSIACGVAVLINLLDLGVFATSGASFDSAIYELLITVINCVFYLYLTKSFINAKQQNNLGLVNYNLLIITIFDYVLPSIQFFLINMIFNGVVVALASTLLSVAILGILYFIFLARNNKNIGKRNNLYLTIIGALILIINCAIAGLYITLGVQNFIGAELNISTILNGLSLILSGFESIMMGCLYFAFPIFLKRDSSL